jgi:hypothetical protein
MSQQSLRCSFRKQSHWLQKQLLNYSEEVIRIAVAPQITEDKYFGENGAGIPI